MDASVKPRFVRKYRQSGIPFSWVYKSNNAISTQDLAELFAYNNFPSCWPYSSGLSQLRSLILLAKYLMLADKLSIVSPVINGAAEASPQPVLPKLFFSPRRTVFAKQTVSPDILIGSMSGIKRG